MSSASLFGSYARGEANEDSDIDVLLYRGDGFQPLGVFGFAEDLGRTTEKGAGLGSRRPRIEDITP